MKATKRVTGVRISTTVAPAIAAAAHKLTAPPVEGPLTAASYPVAVEWLRRAKAKIADVETFFADLKRPLNDARATILSKEHETLDAPKAVVARVTGWIAAYREAAARAQRLAEEEARRQADEQAAAERAAQVAALQRAAAAQPSPGAREALTAQASALEAAPLVPPAVTLGTTTLADGVSTRTTYAAEVYDFEQLVMACAAPLFRKRLRQGAAAEEQAVPGWLLDWPTAGIECLQPNLPVLNALAVQCRDELPTPGVRSVRKTSVVVR